MAELTFLQQAARVHPSKQQMAWFDLNFYAFAHFGVNTYTGREWGDGHEDEALFHPVSLDCDQWCEAYKEAGMKAVILTAKHHDGFCLWPSKVTAHSVKNASVKVDVVKALSEACRRHGLKFGVYLSPWDRNASCYGTDAYNDFYCDQLKELLTGYGDLFCVWFDNACGEGPSGRRQEYDFPRYIRLIRQYQPDAVIFNDYGPDVRWIGNESGTSRHAEWAVVPSELCRYASVQTGPGPRSGSLWYLYNPDPDLGSLQNISYSKGLVFCPAETDMSIRKGWFYHPEEHPHSLERLTQTYLTSSGANSCFNLNIPPAPDGRLAAEDVQRLRELGAWIRDLEEPDLSKDASFTVKPYSETQQEITIDLGHEETIRGVELREDLSQGQRVEDFQIREEGKDVRVTVLYTGTTIGYRRLCLFPRPYSGRRLILAITSSRDTPVLKKIRVF